jgi:hypothetical protein
MKNLVLINGEYTLVDSPDVPVAEPVVSNEPMITPPESNGRIKVYNAVTKEITEIDAPDMSGNKIISAEPTLEERIAALESLELGKGVSAQIEFLRIQVRLGKITVEQIKTSYGTDTANKVKAVI